MKYRAGHCYKNKSNGIEIQLVRRATGKSAMWLTKRSGRKGGKVHHVKEHDLATHWERI